MKPYVKLCFVLIEGALKLLLSAKLRLTAEDKNYLDLLNKKGMGM